MKRGNQMDFEDFEGFKRIKNIKKLNVEQLVSILSAYKEILGEISYVIGLDYAKIYIDFKGRYGESEEMEKTSPLSPPSSSLSLLFLFSVFVLPPSPLPIFLHVAHL